MKQKNVPRELLIKDNLWAIKFIHKIPGNDKDLLGLCDPSCLTIFLKKKQNFTELADTLIHEIIHAFEYEYDFSLNHKHVYKLGEAFASLWVENF